MWAGGHDNDDKSSRLTHAAGPKAAIHVHGVHATTQPRVGQR